MTGYSHQHPPGRLDGNCHRGLGAPTLLGQRLMDTINPVLRVFQGLCSQIRDSPFTYAGKLLPMRILPKGYSFPATDTGGLTSTFPKESRLAAASKRGSLCT